MKATFGFKSTMKTWRVDSTPARAPRLSLTELSPMDLNMSSAAATGGSPPPSSPPNIHSWSNVLESNGIDVVTQHNLNNAASPKSALSQAQMQTPTRRASGMLNLSIPPSPLDTNNKDSTAPDSENSSPWTGAVGRASLGKSGRVIERLMSENDKLKRSLNAEKSHRQEVEKREMLHRGAVDALEAEKANLQQAKEVDAAVLRRRDRVVEELRAELSLEKSGRLKAEDNLKKVQSEREETEREMRRELANEKEKARHAAGHAEVLEESHRRLGDEYRKRVSTIRDDFATIQQEREQDKAKLKRLEVVSENMGNELERASKTNLQLEEKMLAYEEEATRRVEELTAKLRLQEAENDRVRAEAEKVAGEARHLINIGKNAVDRFNNSAVQ